MLATSDFLDQPFNTAYYGHEVGHQWWGALVRVNGTSGVWMLQEGLAQYCSLRAVEIIEGAEKAKQYRSRLIIQAILNLNPLAQAIYVLRRLVSINL